MEIKIGIQSAPRELVLQTASSFDELERVVRTAVADGSVIAFSGETGGRVLVPADKLAYLEVGSSGPRRVGFGGG